MFLHLLVGIGFAVVAAVTVVYKSMCSSHPPHQYQWRSQLDNQNDNDSHGSNGDKLRKSRVGDRCVMCLERMSAETMRTMHCGHALHIECFQQYRELSRHCPYCDKRVIRINLPGEDCAICCEPMEAPSMKYLKCEHALHKTCLSNYKRSYYYVCPVCKRSL